MSDRNRSNELRPPGATGNREKNMKNMQIRCKAFAGGKVAIQKIQVDDKGVIRVWDEIAGHYTTCHSLTNKTIGRINSLLGQNNVLDFPHSYPCPAR